MRARAAAALAIALLGGLALADGLDARGWTAGQIAVGTPKVLGPIAEEPVVIELPKALAKRIKGKAFLFYFSATCPHCKHVAPEVAALARSLAGQADVIGIATSGSSPDAVAAFSTTYDLGFEIVSDADGAIGRAMGARSTPSSLLVERVGKELRVIDVWYPYSPGTDALVQMRASGIPFSSFAKGQYQGNTPCFACHQQEAESWALTHHSIAWGTLVEAGSQQDPACTSCHVTGAGQPTGWTPGDDDLTDVGCESCHGPGGPHDGERVDAKTTCAGCHDAKHSIAFSLDKGLPLIDHFLTNTLEAPAWRERREALIEGKASRPLLAFADAPYVGAAACQTCHAAEHASWAASPHGRAMASLDKHARTTDTECVSCHATATVSGPRPTELSGYRVDEAVGCESCHGPGGQHVAAGGGKDNIVGLGESCPVCVIEAVCTSCHTEAWDPLWDLDVRLPAAKHSAP